MSWRLSLRLGELKDPRGTSSTLSLCDVGHKLAGQCVLVDVWRVYEAVAGPCVQTCTVAACRRLPTELGTRGTKRLDRNSWRVYY